MKKTMSMTVPGIVETMPASVDQTDNRGMEDIDVADLVIPRAKLLQPLSPELRDDKHLRPGMIINSLTKEELPADIIPVFYFKSFARFNARDRKLPGYVEGVDPGALIWQTRDASDPRVIKECSFGLNGETPIALTTLNFFCITLPDSGIPVVVSFSKTSYKAGRNFLSLCKLRGGAMFSRRYRLTAKEESNDKGNYFTLVVNPAESCDADQLAAGERYFNQFATKRDAVKPHIEDAETL